jgi:hypothetical protein
METMFSGSHRHVNVIHVSVDAAPTEGRDAAVDVVNSHMCGIYQERVVKNFTNTAHFVGCHWMDLDSLDGRTGDLGPAAGHPGNGTDPAQWPPLQVSFLVHLQSTQRIGQRQGRMYVSGPAEAEIDNAGAISSTVLASEYTALNGMRTDITGIVIPDIGGDFNPAAWRTIHVHKLDPVDPTTWTWSSTTVDNCVVDPQVATQRRRNR